MKKFKKDKKFKKGKKEKEGKKSLEKFSGYGTPTGVNWVLQS